MDITNKTIFDYCTDGHLLKSITGGYGKEYYNTLPPIVKIGHLREYAARTNDTTLFEAASKALNKAEIQYNAQKQRAQKQGLIIDN